MSREAFSLSNLDLSLSLRRHRCPTRQAGGQRRRWEYYHRGSLLTRSNEWPKDGHSEWVVA